MPLVRVPVGGEDAALVVGMSVEEVGDRMRLKEVDRLVHTEVMGHESSDRAIAYTKHIVLAWHAVVRIGEPLTLISGYGGEGEWRCRFGIDAHDREVAAPSAALAICLAALLAKGVQVQHPIEDAELSNPGGCYD